jgi:Putative Ig domain
VGLGEMHSFKSHMMTIVATGVLATALVLTVMTSTAIAGAAGGTSEKSTETMSGGALPPASLSTTPVADVQNQFDGVSCVSSTDCVAVGYSVIGQETHTEIESWDGSYWSIVPSPNLNDLYDALHSVSCTNPNACVAVGAYSNGTEGQTLIESWDGTSWTVTPSPNMGTGENILYGVSCISPTDCTAVGVQFNTPVGGPLIESWDGTSWSVVPTPDPAAGGQLRSVSCTSGINCMAAGFSGLTESWDGNSWTVVPSPDQSGQSPMGVSCSDSTHCVAVGSVIESWDGTIWTLDPNPGTGYLTSDSCITPASCLAVGTIAHPNDSTYAESWDGSVWSVIPSLNPVGRSSGFLSGVSCTSSTSCMAVGYSDLFGFQNRETLTESWNGISWVILPSPNVGELAITTTVLPGGSVWTKTHKVFYSATLLATSGNPPYKWSLAPGSNPLPPGLHVRKSTGVISGKATTPGTYSFTAQVVDTKTPRSKGHPRTQNTATAQMSITINPGP